jgi:hypothetical protein
MVRINTVPGNDRGTFSIDVPVGRATLVARADGYVSEVRELLVRPGAANPTVHFTLAPAGSVSGRVFDETGAGLAGARVWLDYPGKPRAWRFGEETGGEAADAFGYFTLEAVAQGRPFVLHAESDGWLPSSSGPLVLRASEMSGVVLLLSRHGATVRGRVIGPGGQPVIGAKLRLRAVPAQSEFTPEQRASAMFARSTHKTTASGADGSYVFAGVPSGRVVVTAEAGRQRAFAEATATANQEVEVILALR